jgi:hypothetical protein
MSGDLWVWLSRLLDGEKLVRRDVTGHATGSPILADIHMSLKSPKYLEYLESAKGKSLQTSVDELH